MSYVSVSSEDLIVIALTVLFATWKLPTLKPIGMLLVIAAAVTPFTSPLSAPAKGLVYLPLDVIGGIVALIIWRFTGEKVGKWFFRFSLACLAAHLVMFSHPPHTDAQNWWYTATLNVLFISFCLYVGGTGFGRLHRHLREHWGHRPARVSVGSGG